MYSEDWRILACNTQPCLETHVMCYLIPLYVFQRLPKLKGGCNLRFHNVKWSQWILSVEYLT